MATEVKGTTMGEGEVVCYYGELLEKKGFERVPIDEKVIAEELSGHERFSDMGTYEYTSSSSHTNVKVYEAPSGSGYEARVKYVEVGSEPKNLAGEFDEKKSPLNEDAVKIKELLFF